MKILPKISLLLLLSAILVVAGCGTTGEAEQEDPAAVGGGAAADAQASAGTDTQADATPQEPPPEEKKNPLEEGLLANRVVYFDYDSSVVKDEAMPIIRAHAEYLANAGSAITLEGHADERGTREYNIALGERRADAVRRILMANGVGSNQIKIVSYGEERPAALGHSEDAWALNRRSEFMYER